MNHPNIGIIISDTWQKGATSVDFGSARIYGEINEALRLVRGSLIGRFGSTELTTVCLSIYNEGSNKEEKLERANLLEQYSGIFPATISTVDMWMKEYMTSVSEVNIMVAGWYEPLAVPEKTLLDNFCPMAPRIPLRSLEPYYSSVDYCWTKALENQKVCVVSSFAETMAEQIKVAEKIWPQRAYILPNAEWSFVRSYYPPSIAKGECEWPSGIATWKSAVDYLYKEIMKTGARIVLLGCGALAMPLGARLKKQGKICIVMGGAIQVMFGIKGRRWENHSYISELFNDDWMYPSDSEVPGGAKQIEGGCYW